MVLDNDGNHVYMDRMDGQGYLNIITAEMKARTALMGREASKNRMNRVIQDPNAELQRIQLGMFCEFRRSSRRRQQAADRRRRRRRFRAARAGVERRDLRAQGADRSDRAIRRAAGGGPSAAPEPQSGHCAGSALCAAAPPKSSLPAEFVVGGKGAANVFDGNQISLAAAKKIARVCRDWAASKGGTMSLYIIDTAGEFVHMERMDGQVFNNIRTAMLKAQTSLKTRQPTSLNAGAAQEQSRRPAAVHHLLQPSSRTRAAFRSWSTAR